MFDPILRRLVDPPLNAAGRRLAASGLHADTITLVGFAFGLGGAAAIVFGHGWIALALILLNRLADGLDGALARAGRQTDRGGYLDIVLDFFFYGAVPFGFALAAPQTNGLAAAALLLAFYMNGASFLAFAVMAEKRRLSTEAQGRKSLYYLGGLAEGGETIAVFAAMCLFPGWFPALAYGFALLCTVSALARVAMVMQMLKD